MSTAEAVRGVPVRRSTIQWGVLLVAAEALALLAYYTFSGNRLVGITPLLPMVWINVGLWALVRTDPPPAGQRTKTRALALATAYVALLAYLGGLWGQPSPVVPYGVDVTALNAPPGWNPRLYVNTPLVRVHLLPYKVVGYLALGYLVYARILEVSGAVVSGLLSLVSCVSCTWPIFATILGGIAGTSGGFYAAAVANSYPIATGIFVVTVGLLSWTPDWS